jgi:hypothetical protein
MKKTMNSLHQQFLTNSLFACAHILSSEDEGMELYATWNKGWTKMSENDKDAKNAKLQSSTILEEILWRIFSKDNPALALQIQHARTKVPGRIWWESMRYTLSGSTFHRQPLMLLYATLSECSCFHYRHRGVPHLQSGTASFRSRLRT